MLLRTGMILEKAGGSPEALWFITREGEAFKMFPQEEWGSYVYLDDIAGDMSDLIGHPLLLADVASNQKWSENQWQERESETWTFYKFSTIRGSITLRWYGGSNGHYSEEVDMAEVPVEEAEAAIASAKWKWGC